MLGLVLLASLCRRSRSMGFWFLGYRSKGLKGVNSVGVVYTVPRTKSLLWIWFGFVGTLELLFESRVSLLGEVTRTS